ncbi:MAG TPA: hypothetical protein PLP88_04445 [Bacteroidales bacterium]|nr:hypothetical protein [Bacteroidales bacterium]
MNTSLKFSGILVAAIMLLMSVSCEKDPGEGGNSTIYGKVWVREYNSSFTYLQEEYYGQDEDVYIIYGDDKMYSDHVKTSYDGTYEFKYLRKGDYRIFAYSKDSTGTTNAKIPVIKDVTISNNNETVEVPRIVIVN